MLKYNYYKRLGVSSKFSKKTTLLKNNKNLEIKRHTRWFKTGSKGLSKKYRRLLNKI